MAQSDTYFSSLELNSGEILEGVFMLAREKDYPKLADSLRKKGDTYIGIVNGRLVQINEYSDTGKSKKNVKTATKMTVPNDPVITAEDLLA